MPPIPAEVFDVNATDLEWVNRQCTMQSLATFQQAVTLTRNRDAVENVTFILATGSTIPRFPSFTSGRKDKRLEDATMSCGHDVMLDRPEELTSALLGVAAAQSAAL